MPSKKKPTPPKPSAPKSDAPKKRLPSDGEHEPAPARRGKGKAGGEEE